MSTVLPFPQYAPDIAPLNQSDSQIISNVFPRQDGYAPCPGATALSQALPAAGRGLFYARNADGSITIFAATSTRLWKLQNTDQSWIPVSKVIQLTSISNATPAVFTLNNHGLSIGDAFVLSTTGTLPTGLSVGTVYYVATTSFGANSFKAAATLADALAGTNLIATSSAGSGNHSFTGYYTAVPSSDQWQFTQFNNFVIAVQINTVPQAFDLTSSAAFANLSADSNMPQARYCSVVNRFLVLSGLGTSTPYRIQWSGLNSISGATSWTSGVNQSDYQDLPDGGIVRGVAGGEYGLIMQDTAVRRMIYAPGSSYVFQIERISQDKGIFAPLSLCTGGERAFFLGSSGVKMVNPGGYPEAIGRERVDRYISTDIDNSDLQLCLGASDPKNTRIFIAYNSLAGASGQFDKIICYDYTLDRFSLLNISGEYISTLVSPGITLDALDSVSSSIDALTLSLDAISTTTLPQISIIDTSHKVALLTGSNLEATIDTNENEMDGQRRIRIQGARPVTDAASCYVSVGIREAVQSTVSYTTEQRVLSNGFCPANVSTRLARMRLRVASATTWTYASGVEVKTAQEGRW